ncbi:MAG: 50S ribosomal protein L20 [Acholeplasmataceae bacterium]
MPRVKSGVQTRKRRKKILKQAKGYFGSKRTLYRTANEQVMRSLNYAYISRRLRKRDFRKLWIQRINAACKLHGYKYSHLIHGLSLANVEINRKMLADMAVHDMEGFKQLIDISKHAIENKSSDKVVVRKAKLVKVEKEEKVVEKKAKPTKETKVVEEKPAKEVKHVEEKPTKEVKSEKETKPIVEDKVEEKVEEPVEEVSLDEEHEELDEETLEGVETSDEDDDEDDADHDGTSFVYHISQVKDEKSPHYRKWRVRRSGSKKTIKHFETQKDAIVAAKRYADSNDTRIVVHKRDGRIRKHN